jgi:hypothetical protein
MPWDDPGDRRRPSTPPPPSKGGKQALRDNDLEAIAVRDPLHFITVVEERDRLRGEVASLLREMRSTEAAVRGAARSSGSDGAAVSEGSTDRMRHLRPIALEPASAEPAPRARTGVILCDCGAPYCARIAAHADGAEIVALVCRPCRRVEMLHGGRLAGCFVFSPD